MSKLACSFWSARFSHWSISSSLYMKNVSFDADWRQFLTYVVSGGRSTNAFKWKHSSVLMCFCKRLSIIMAVIFVSGWIQLHFNIKSVLRSLVSTGRGLKSECQMSVLNAAIIQRALQILILKKGPEFYNKVTCHGALCAWPLHHLYRCITFWIGDKFSKSGVFHLLLPSHVSNIESLSSVFPAIISGNALPIATNHAINVNIWMRFGKWSRETMTFDKDFNPL